MLSPSSSSRTACAPHWRPGGAARHLPRERAGKRLHRREQHTLGVAEHPHEADPDDREREQGTVPKLSPTSFHPYPRPAEQRREGAHGEREREEQDREEEREHHDAEPGDDDKPAPSRLDQVVVHHPLWLRRTAEEHRCQRVLLRSGDRQVPLRLHRDPCLGVDAPVAVVRRLPLVGARSPFDRFTT